jgi:hypothetical protein
MTFVTLIGKKLAHKGAEFVYVGVPSRCRECRLKTVCSNPKEGRRYRITKVRGKHHDCELHDEGVVPVEIEQLPIETTIPSEGTKGTEVTYHEVECNNIGCERYDICHPGVTEKKYRILEVLDDVDCPEGYDLKLVLLDD